MYTIKNSIKQGAMLVTTTVHGTCPIFSAIVTMEVDYSKELHFEKLVYFPPQT